MLERVLANKDMADTAGPSKNGVRRAPATHPSWYEMVIEAVSSNKDSKGASVQAIKTYIVATYPTVDQNSMRHHIKRALEKGIKLKLLKRPKASEDATGLTGRFKLDKVTVAAEAKAKAKKLKKAEEKKENVVKKKKTSPVKRKTKTEKSEKSEKAKKTSAKAKASAKSPKKVRKGVETTPTAPRSKKAEMKTPKKPKSATAKSKVTATEKKKVSCEVVYDVALVLDQLLIICKKIGKYQYDKYP